MPLASQEIARARFFFFERERNREGNSSDASCEARERVLFYVLDTFGGAKDKTSDTSLQGKR